MGAAPQPGSPALRRGGRRGPDADTSGLCAPLAAQHHTALRAIGARASKCCDFIVRLWPWCAPLVLCIASRGVGPEL